MQNAEKGSWVSKIAALQDAKTYAELNWEGSFEDYLEIVRKNPKVTRTAYQRIYDMILSHGKTEYIDNKKKLIRYHFFSDEKFGGRDAIFGLDVPLMKLVNVFKSAAQGYGTEKRVILLHGPVGSSKSTIARLLKKGMEEYSKTPEGAAYTYSWTTDKKQPDGTVTKEKMKCPMNEEPLNLIPREWRPKIFAELSPSESGYTVPDRLRAVPRLPLRLQGSDDAVRGRLRQGHGPHPRQPAHLQREGPRRHRHLPAQGREEPGLHRAHRRHQLPQDRRVRLRLRPARLQLRRRVQHRQPRHHRVRRGAQARRGLPLRSARRLAGAQDQAEEVPPDGHRRGHHRPHQRARVQEAPEQRVHGGLARPHGEDRRAVHHQAGRGGEDLREGLQLARHQGQAHRPAHARDGRHVGGADAPGGAQEAQPHAAAEAQALQRQDAPQLHRGQHQGAAQGGHRARAWRASPPATSRTRSPTPW